MCACAARVKVWCPSTRRRRNWHLSKDLNPDLTVLETAVLPLHYSDIRRYGSRTHYYKLMRLMWYIRFTHPQCKVQLFLTNPKGTVCEGKTCLRYRQLFSYSAKRIGVISLAHHHSQPQVLVKLLRTFFNHSVGCAVSITRS